MTSKLHKLIIISRMNFHHKIAPVGKRGSMLSRLVSDKDRRKHWHLDVLAKPTEKTNIFEKVHKPNKRAAVLNNLFIENITDVLSTGDICPEIIGSGIEITEVKISPDFRILNVYWQIPVSKLDSKQDLKALLAIAAPKIRSELISRNVMGRVPKIYFVQDTTNERLVEFQKALESADLGPDAEAVTVPEQGFLDELLVFKSAREEKRERLKVAKAIACGGVKVDESMPEEVQPRQEDTKEELSLQPKPPADMQMDVCGLNYKVLMEKVMATKKKTAQVTEPVAATSDCLGDNLFDKIPGQPLFNDREKLLTQFCVERKIQKQKRNEMNEQDTNILYVPKNDQVEDVDPYEPDYYDENDCGH